jgi:uroporphyrinogen decarboxylase
MGLTHKERVQRAFRREPVDRLPTQVSFTPAMGKRLARHLRVAPGDLPARLDNHLVRVDLTVPHRMSDDSRTRYDWWGVGWSTEEEGYFLTDSPLSDAQMVNGYSWPAPQEPGLLDRAADVIASAGDEYFIAPNFGFCLFERAWSLRGFEPFLMDLAMSPAFVEELLEHITQIQVVLARRFLDLGVDGGYFGDDYGAQKNLLFSPRTWRALFKPRLARIFGVFRNADLPVILHSDGDITEILPDLVDIGVTVLNPVQPEVLDHTWLKRTFGVRLAFYGGVSTQTVLPHGSPDDVLAAVSSCVRTLAEDGTGLLLGPSHRTMTDIPLENMDALLTGLGGHQ